MTKIGDKCPFLSPMTGFQMQNRFLQPASSIATCCKASSSAALEAGRHRAGYDSLIFMDEIVVE